MTDFLARLLLIFLSMTLVSVEGDRDVQAQSLQPIEVPTDEVTPDVVQPSPSPIMTPTDAPPVDQTQPRRPRSSIGLGGSIGVSGEDTGLSEGGLAIISRNDLNDAFSIRGTTVFGNSRTDNAIALTVNFPIRSTSGNVQLIPYAGGGLLISSKSFFNDVIVRGLVTGGIDIPISRRFTATAAANVGFTDTTNVGVRLGVMYGF
jgi:hypothetical protein